MKTAIKCKIQTVPLAPHQIDTLGSRHRNIK